MVQENKLHLQKSRSSFKLSEVTGFVFGPFPSRFWMLRKHMIMMSAKDLKDDAPFYAWDCITLNIKEKWDVYLIIRSETLMSDFLKLLISKTETIDGSRGTAIPFRKLHLKSQLKLVRGQKLSKDQKNILKEKVRVHMEQRVFSKYSIMRIR